MPILPASLENKYFKYPTEQIKHRKEIPPLQMKEEVAKGVLDIHNKHYSISHRVAFAFLVVATGGLAYLFKKLVSGLALQSKLTQLTSSQRHKKQLFLSEKKNAFLKGGVFENANYSRTFSYGIPTVDGEGKLDAAIVFSDEESAKEFEKKEHSKDACWMVYLNGNNGHYEEMMEDLDCQAGAIQRNLRETNKSAKVHVAMFNYRGIGYSEGSADCADHLVLDGITMCQFLLNQGIPANRIFLDGLSMGGLSSTKAYSFFNQCAERINLIRERTFSKLSRVAKIIGESISGSKLGAFAEWAFRSMNWHGDAEKALSKRGESWGTVLELYHPEDRMMQGGAVLREVAEHKAGNTTNTSIIALPLRFEVARDNFDNFERIANPEDVDRLRIYKEIDALTAQRASFEENIKEWEQRKFDVSGLKELLSKVEGQLEARKWLPLLDKHEILPQLKYLRKLVCNSLDQEEFFTHLEAYSAALNILIEDEKHFLPKAVLKTLQGQQNLVRLSVNLTEKGDAHDLNVTQTKKWKEEIIPAIAEVFQKVMKEPTKKEDL